MLIILIAMAHVVSGVDIASENEWKIRAALRVGSYAFAGDLIRIGGGGDDDGDSDAVAEEEEEEDHRRNPAAVLEQDEDGNTPLHLAVLNKNHKIARRLARMYGLADLNAKNKLGFTALHAASAIGNKLAAILLITRNVEIDPMAFDGSTPFSIAVDTSVDTTNDKPREGIAELLWKRGANIRPKIWNDCDNFLHRAIVNNCYDLAIKVVRKGALTKEEMNAKCDGCPPLCMAIGYISTVELATVLIYAGVDMTAADDEKNTALHYAVGSNNDDFLTLVLRHDVDLEATDGSGFTPLQFAMWRHSSRSALILIEFGAEISSNVDVPVLMRNQYPHLAEIIKENGADFDTFDDYVAAATDAHMKDRFGRNAFPKRLSTLVHRYEMSEMYALYRLLKSQYAGKLAESSAVEDKKFRTLDRVFLNMVEKTYMDLVPGEIVQDVFFIAGHYARNADRLSHLLALASHKLNIDVENSKMRKLRSEKLKAFVKNELCKPPKINFRKNASITDFYF